MSGYNVDLMLQIRDQITSHPESHDQKSWGEKTECGTTHCIAGWALHFSGDELYWADGALVEVRQTGGVWASLFVHAAQHLGLDFEEAEKLFSGNLGERSALAMLDRFIAAGKNGSSVSAPQ